jgi:uncharacterized LabA/DUF88 family protein
MQKTIVYIDGFNLYYRALKGTRHKWLDIEALSWACLPSNVEVVEVNYYTARVSGKRDPDDPRSQQAYLNALATKPTIKIHFGKFLIAEKWSPLVPPIPHFKPEPVVAKVYKTEEKGSDVNLGVHLVRDACLKKFDRAAVLTNDTDLCEPIRIVRDEIGLPVTLLTPCNNPHSSLRQVATEVRRIKPYLGPCQFPEAMKDADGDDIVKPSDW